MITRTRNAKRAGVTTVEVSIVLALFLMFLFGIFEYSRYLMVLHVTTNAARDGARYASVNVARDGNFDTVDSSLTDSQGNTLISIRKYTTQRMVGVDELIAGFQVDTFKCNTADLFADPPSITPDGSVAWNQATFGERIAVRITGTYNSMLPNLLLMPSSIPISISAAISSEG